MNELWAITSFFNPVGYKTKLKNYRVFRKHLHVPLVTVELSYGAGFELAPGDAERLVQIRGGDVMWQKERLLNVALRHLPDECKYVAWLDCEIVFERTDWPLAAIDQLQRVKLCQLYHTVHHYGPDADVEDFRPELAFLRHVSIGYAHSAGIVTHVGPTVYGHPNAFKRGHAWCARRDLLDHRGLYDRNILGSGDKMIAFAVTAQWEEVIAFDALSPAHAADYRRWALPFHDSTHGGMGYVDSGIFHLWHGDFRRRHYYERIKILNAFDYNPAADVTVDTEGCWRWNSPKYEMHQKIREYFQGRSEDDGNVPASAGESTVIFPGSAT
jgi:hypothetical protein